MSLNRCRACTSAPFENEEETVVAVAPKVNTPLVRTKPARSRSYAFYGAPPPVFNDNGDIVWIPKKSKSGRFESLPQSSHSLFLPSSNSSFKTRNTFTSINITASKRFNFGAADTIGRRDSMEDSMCIVGEISSESDLIGVFDGHNGTEASTFAAESIPTFFQTALANGKSIGEALKCSFLECHEKIVESGMKSGTTAVTALLAEDKCYIAHVGDSRAVLVKKNKVIQSLTRDHRTTDKTECEGIISRGGQIKEVNGAIRVDGKVTITRALGDSSMPSLGHEPEIISFDLNQAFFDETRYLILGCDGVWDYLPNEDIIGYLFLSSPLEDAECAAVELRGAAYGNESTDNISLIVVDFGSFQNPNR